MPAELRKLIRQQRFPSEQTTDKQDERQCRKDAANSARIEIREAEGLAAKIRKNDPGDEIAGDDEEYVHTGKAARKQARKSVKNEHAGHGHCTQAINVGTIFEMRFRGHVSFFFEF